MKTPTQPNADATQDLLDTDHIEQKIPESQGDLADRAGEEIESDLQWRIDMIRRASREDYSKRSQNKDS